MQPNASTTPSDRWVPNCEQPWVHILTYANDDPDVYDSQWYRTANNPNTTWRLEEDYVKGSAMQRGGPKGQGKGEKGKGLKGKGESPNTTHGKSKGKSKGKGPNAYIEGQKGKGPNAGMNNPKGKGKAKGNAKGKGKGRRRG